MQLQRAVLISPTRMAFSCLKHHQSPQRSFLTKATLCCYCGLRAAYPLQRAANTSHFNKHSCIFSAKTAKSLHLDHCVTIPVLTSHAVHPSQQTRACQWLCPWPLLSKQAQRIAWITDLPWTTAWGNLPGVCTKPSAGSRALLGSAQASSCLKGT